MFHKSTSRAPQETTNRPAGESSNSLLQAFFEGPRRLFTSKISPKCATLIALLCSPSLLACALLSLPALIFQSPSQNAYFHFGRVVEQDPTRWIVFALAAVCAVIAPTLPARIHGQEMEDMF